MSQQNQDHPLQARYEAYVKRELAKGRRDKVLSESEYSELINHFYGEPEPAVTTEEKISFVPMASSDWFRTQQEEVIRAAFQSVMIQAAELTGDSVTGINVIHQSQMEVFGRLFVGGK
jgi:hypothetical protein